MRARKSPLITRRSPLRASQSSISHGQSVHAVCYQPPFANAIAKTTAKMTIITTYSYITMLMPQALPRHDHQIHQIKTPPHVPCAGSPMFSQRSFGCASAGIGSDVTALFFKINGLNSSVFIVPCALKQSSLPLQFFSMELILRKVTIKKSSNKICICITML